MPVISTYVHSGEVDTPKQVEKYKFLEAMQSRMAELIATGANVVVVGDLNVGHTELDIKNWKGNLKNAGFLPEERAYFDTLMKQQGWVDVGRAAHPDVAGRRAQPVHLVFQPGSGFGAQFTSKSAGTDKTVTLSGNYTLADGTRVVPAFALLRQRVLSCTPEWAEAITGIPAFS